MAEGVDAEGLLRVSRALLANHREDACFDLLESRIEEFPEDVLLLKQICNAGLAAEKAEESLPYSLRLAALAETPVELTSALKEVSRLGRRLDLEEVVGELLVKEEKEVIDWCVISQLQELRGDSLASDEALVEAAKLTDGILVLSQRVRLLESRSEYTKAAEAMREMLTLPEGNRPVHLKKLVDLLATGGEIDKALVEVDNWKLMAPGDRSAWMRQSYWLMEDS